ncbi:putative membrane protein [Peptoniphilus sp. ING2-D1G]|nr:putative membrane protein [Peptoniphilus sp. ING2-D1G]
MSNTMIYFIIVVAFMVGLFIFGLYVSRTIKDPDDWVVANQSLGIIPLSGTYFATIVSATSIVSYLGYYYLEGWPGMWNFAGTLLTSFLVQYGLPKKCVLSVLQLSRNTYIRDSEEYILFSHVLLF